jgi:hypothetical protein
MEYEESTFTQVQAPQESSAIDQSLVKLQRTWVFWENYESKSGDKLEWSQSIKKIFSFNDIISLWQFLNNYLGSNPSNIFYNGERVR